jgi:hypothetical protein
MDRDEARDEHGGQAPQERAEKLARRERGWRDWVGPEGMLLDAALASAERAAEAAADEQAPPQNVVLFGLLLPGFIAQDSFDRRVTEG